MPGYNDSELSSIGQTISRDFYVLLHVTKIPEYKLCILLRPISIQNFKTVYQWRACMVIMFLLLTAADLKISKWGRILIIPSFRERAI